VLQIAVLGLWLRLVYVANTLWRWTSRDVVRGSADVGRGLATVLRAPVSGLRRAGWGVFDIVSGAMFGLVSLVPQVVGVLRPLTDPEVAAGRRVYGETIPWRRVRVFPGSYVARLGSTRAGEPIAVVTMRVIHVPPQFDTSTTRGKAWLVHELMHVWQGEHTGPSCMARALVGQLGAGYDYGGEQALLAHAEAGLAAFNPEQQADIMRDYYRRLVTAGDLAPFLPYVHQVLAAGRPAPPGYHRHR
jgi:hypothetical protein